MARVLLVLDDVGEAGRLRRVLRAAGYGIETVSSAADAGAAAHSCDLVVVDAACDGGRALAWAREDGLPGIALGADDEPVGRLRPLRRPADAAALIAALAEGTPMPVPPVPGEPPDPSRLGSAPADPSPEPARTARPPAPAGLRPALARTGAALRALFGPRAAPVSGAQPLDLAALADAARTRDYFEVLSLPRTCTSAEARAAADDLLERLDELGGDADGMADARQAVLDAGDVLGEDGLREAYRAGIGDRSGEQRGSVAQPGSE